MTTLPGESDLNRISPEIIPETIPAIVPGTEEGDICGRDGCIGVIAFPKVENCRCHISPPCEACATNAPTCPDCEWSAT